LFTPMLWNIDHAPWNDLPFEPRTFARHKAADTFRIFCIGDSTTKGTPFASQSAPAKWLAVRLEVALPEADREVAQRVIEAAHQVCPYSNATRGNVEVQLIANGVPVGDAAAA